MISRWWLVPMVLALLLAPRPLPAQQGEGVRVTPRGVLLDFQDADIRLVMSALAEAGGLNVVYSDIPPRRVTMRTSQAVPQENILALMRSIAASNGLALVEEGTFIRVEAAGGGGAGAGGAGAGEAGQAGASPEARLFVYRLRHVRADRLAATLQAVFGGGRGTAEAPGLSRPSLSEALREQRVPPAGAEPPPVAVAASGGPSLPAQLQGQIQIVPDEVTNSLLVRASAADWEVVRRAVEALDLRPLQVVIEGMIVEVRRNRDFELGITGRGSDRGASGSRTGSAVLGGTTPGHLVIEVKRLGGIDLDVALSTLASAGRVRILSRPIVLAQNNQEARILIGAQRPFIQVFRALPTEAAVRDQVVQYRDVGTSLTIRPTINPDGYVNLELTQEVSNATSETQFGAPVISTREASTHLFVKDGRTVVLGGLTEQQRDQSRSGIPFLKDIPILGALFGFTRNNSFRSEFFLFLTPHIIETDEDAERIRARVEGTELAGPQLPAQPLLLAPDSAQARRPDGRTP
ncbi:MAG TPA: secretin N-terminal domain-containing protein [Longimicrobiaceae bacterium]|nr:secretin N-terminal domain-containing protein [Longimicrobiaceae bacterium]